MVRKENMKKLELRLEEEKYVLVADGKKSSTTFSSKFRIMAINKFKFITKNSLLPLHIIVENSDGKVIIDKEIKEFKEVDEVI